MDFSDYLRQVPRDKPRPSASVSDWWANIRTWPDVWPEIKGTSADYSTCQVAIHLDPPLPGGSKTPVPNDARVTVRVARYVWEHTADKSPRLDLPMPPLVFQPGELGDCPSRT
jgi:hypothetical protein